MKVGSSRFAETPQCASSPPRTRSSSCKPAAPARQSPRRGSAAHRAMSSCRRTSRCRLRARSLRISAPPAQPRVEPEHAVRHRAQLEDDLARSCRTRVRDGSVVCGGVSGEGSGLSPQRAGRLATQPPTQRIKARRYSCRAARRRRAATHRRRGRSRDTGCRPDPCACQCC